jgi:hypothetical protein
MYWLITKNNISSILLKQTVRTDNPNRQSKQSANEVIKTFLIFCPKYVGSAIKGIAQKSSQNPGKVFGIIR